MTSFNSFTTAIQYSTDLLLTSGRDVDTGSWQGYSTEGHPDLVTKEILNLQLEVPVTDKPGILQAEIKPNLPWADDHFAERVSRDPSNPGKEYENWPWWQGQEAAAMVGELAEEGVPVFTHTYQERFWPKYNRQGSRRSGVRYNYGDLDDVVTLLASSPHTRQATFPIFFPEDTGAHHGGRVPCTLHYHFMVRDNKLHMWYPIRSCDLVRHFRDDLYMAAKLMLWVLTELQEEELRGDNPQLWVDVSPGVLSFTAYSFHVHKGDLHHVR